MMNWAKERAQKIMGPLKPLINHGMTPQQYDATWDAIAAALQRVADECAEIAGGWTGPINTVKNAGVVTSVCVGIRHSIRVRFPKEER